MFKTIFADEIIQSFKDKRILAVIAIYLLVLAWGMKKVAAFAGIWSIWLMDVTGKQLPFPIIFFYFASIALLPLFSLFLSYDSISGEAPTIRNLVSRCPRSTIFFSKTAAIFLINILANLVMYLIAIDYISYQQQTLYLKQGIILYFFLACFALYFTALAVLSSTLAKTAKKSLFLGALFIFLPLFLLFSEKMRVISPFHYYKYGMSLFTGQASVMPFILLILSSLIFISAAYYIFSRRDL